MDSAAWSALAGWLSAVVALAAAIASGVGAWRSRSAKRQAEQQAKDATEAARQGAANIGRIASTLEARFAPEVNKQALLVYIATSPVVMGNTGWVIMNGSDGPISKLKVTTVNSCQLLVQRGSGPETEDTLEVPMLSPGENTKMFNPWNVDSPVIEQIRFYFNDAQGTRWERTGTGPPHQVD